MDQLTIDKADLLSRLQLSEENFKTADECENCFLFVVCYLYFIVLRLREKAISGMMAAVHRRDTDVEEREERISHLKKVIRSQLLSLCVLTSCNGVHRSLRN